MLYLIQKYGKIETVVEGIRSPSEIVNQYTQLREQWATDLDAFLDLTPGVPELPQKPAGISSREWRESPTMKLWKTKCQDHYLNEQKIITDYKEKNPSPDLKSMLQKQGFLVIDFKIVEPDNLTPSDHPSCWNRDYDE